MSVNWKDLDPFTRGYVEAALWASTADDDTPLDRDHDWRDISVESFAAIAEDCRQFQERYRELLDRASEEIPRRDDAHHGHDYFLTRNGHGAGFWDRGYTDTLGQALTDAAHAEGMDDWYIGDDERVHSELAARRRG
jgi:hypothetical protein